MTLWRLTRLGRVVPYLVVGAMGTFLLVSTTQFEFQHRPGTLGPDIWPQLILGLLLVVCLMEIARIVLARAAEDDGTGVLEAIARKAGTAAAEEPAALPAQSHPWLLLGGMAATLVYVGLVGVTGFALTTAVYLAVFLVIGGYRRRGVIAMLSVGGALLLMFIFMKLVYVSLPIGSGPFADLTILLMRLMGIR